MEFATVTVKASTHAYSMHVGNRLLAHAGDLWKANHLPLTAALLTDQNCINQAEVLIKSLQEIGCQTLTRILPSGETSKDFFHAADLYSWLAQNKFDRASTIITVGGGVTGDLGGFVAATYLRGVALVHVPTTLLAMVDSAIGGKTGVNIPEGKNLVGAIWQPRLVLADLDTLTTLPAKELSSGMAEVIKYGLIADPELLEIAAQPGQPDWQHLVRRSVEIKAAIVAQDEHETKGVREFLNFGHTLGHAIERAAGYGTIRHGEAIAVGMRVVVGHSIRHLGLDLAVGEKLDAVLKRWNLPLSVPSLKGKRDAIRAGISTDKKARAGKIRWVLLPKIGKPQLSVEVSSEQVEDMLNAALVEAN